MIDDVAQPSLLGRKSVMMGLLTSGVMIAEAARPSSAAAGTIKPIAATPPPYAPRWAPATAYALGWQVVSPNNDIVSANVAHTSSTAYATDTAKWTLSSTYARFFMPEAYGAAASYNVAVDDTAAVQAAINAAVAAGGEVRLSRVYQIQNGGLTASGPVKISGVGGRFASSNQGGTFPGIATSGFRCPSTTADCLTTTAAAPILTDFAIINTAGSAPTAGVGLRINAGYNHAVVRVTVAGFYNCIKIDGRFGTIDSCHFLDPVNYGMWFVDLLAPGDSGDFGDQGISNCVVGMYGRTTTAEAAVRWDSGGGIRWSNNKIVAGTGPGAASIGNFKYGLDVMVADQCQTGEWEILGGGISTCTVACMRIGTVGSGGMYGITTHGVIFQGANTTARGIIVGARDPSLNNGVRAVIINGCTFIGVPTGGIEAYNLKGLVIGTNWWDDAATFTGPLITLAGGNDNGIATQGVTIAKQNIGPNLHGVDIVLDKRQPSVTVQSYTGDIDYNYTQNLGTSAIGTWVTAGYVDLSTFDGVVLLDVELTGSEGWSGGGSPFYAHRRRVATVPAGGGTPTVVTLGTDETAGTGTHYEVQYLTTTANRVTIQYRVTAGGADGLLWGRIAITARGEVARFHVGP